MSVADPIGDMITIIRNGVGVGFDEVSFPFSKLRQGILNVLKREGFIEDFVSVKNENSTYSLKVKLRYGPNGEKVINHISKVSKPGRRIYIKKADIPRLKSGLGTMIVSTSKGILSGREARIQKTGGEALCQVW